ncbi:hypothetical protein ACHAXT_012919 [Thalassiosira profunda]
MAEQSSPPTNGGPAHTLSELQTELSSLNRVSHRLAMTDAGPALQKVLSLLLPRLLARIGKNDEAKRANRRSNIHKRKSPSPTAGAAPSNDGNGNNGCEVIYEQIDGMHESIHKKLIEMIGHSMKRVREDRGCKLPCLSILELLLPSEEEKGTVTANAFTINLGLAFLTLGVNRCTPAECAGLLPGLLQFLGCNLDQANNKGNEVGVGHLLDPSRKMRHDQTWHLVLRCLEGVSHNPSETTAARRAAQKSASSVSDSSNASGTSEPTAVASLAETKKVLASHPILAAALFDLFVDVLLYSPVPATSTLTPNGLSTAGYQRLVGGAASEKAGCKTWKEEFVARGSLRTLKLKLLDLVAPCRRYALFLPEKADATSSGEEGNDSVQASSDGMGISRTVALMVLLTGDADPDVKGKAESYLRAHMDTYRGKEAPQASNSTSGTSADDETALAETTIHDALLGNSVALVQTILILAIGGASSLSTDKSLSSQYTNGTAAGILKSRLGLSFTADASNAAQQKAFLSCSRMKLSELSSTSALKFVAKTIDDNPKLFHVGMDMELAESDVAAVSIGSLVLAVLGDLHRPGSSASPAMESASTLLNSLCVRLSLFYDARAQSGVDVSDSLERMRLLLARSMAQACAVLAPTSSGESTSSGSSGTKASSVPIEIRDKCYGVVCTLARSQFALDDRYSLFDCGNSKERTASSFPLTTISSAALLFGCSSNEVEMLRPRATSALDALLGAYVRVVTFLAEKEREQEQAENAPKSEPANPWASIPETSVEEKKANMNVSTDGLARSLLPLLWSASRRSQPKSSRLASVRWSSELLLRLDNTNAYHLLCFLSGDEDATVSMIAKQALGVDKTLGEDNVLTLDATEEASDTNTNRASFSVLMDTIVESQPHAKRPTYSEFHVRAQAATLRFLLQALFSEESFYGDEDGGTALKAFVLTLLQTFASYKGRSLTREEADLLDECSVALASCTSTSKEARVAVASVVTQCASTGSYFGPSDVAAQALASSSSKTRRQLAEVMGHLYEDHLLWQDEPTKPLSLASWIESTGLGSIAKTCGEKLATMSEGSFVVGEVHGAAFLGAACVRALRLAAAGNMANDEDHPIISECWENCCRIVSLLGKGLAHTDVAIGNAVSKGLVNAFSYDSQDAPVLDARLFDAVAIALDEMNAALKRFSSIDHADPTRATALVQAAGLLLAASTSGAGFTKGETPETNGSNTVDLGPARLQCTEALFAVLGSAVYRKDDEVALAVGEALVKYADAFGSGEWSSGSAEWKEGPYDEKYAFDLPPHKHVLYTMFLRELVSSNPMKRNSCAAPLLALVGHASRMANLDPSYANRDFFQECWTHLSLFQTSFIKLLADPKSKHLSRESASKGLAACRGLAAVMSSSMTDGESVSQGHVESLNEQLLKAFGQTTNYGGSMMQETDAQARERRNDDEGNNESNEPAAQVGGAAGMSEATLGAYREMASAAISLGQVDVLYSLMILSTNHPIWQLSDKRDRYSAKALLGKAEGASVEEIRISLRPHLGKLIPKLLRACNDPSKQTREQMNVLWLALSGGGAESRALITQNFLPTLDVLIQDAGSNLWRARVGACGALADIIVGRSWEELGGGGVEIDDEGSATTATASIRLLRLWRITMRALDDVRTAVRERGEGLGRGTRALTIRLCDPTVSDASQESDVYLSNADRKEREKQSQVSAECAATVSLGWLIKYGLNQPCAEATGICISCLLGIVDVAKPETLQPVLPELVGSLLMAMSSLEPSALNYLQVRAAGNDNGNASGSDRYDRLERLRINLAQSGPIAEALHKCLEMVRFVDLDAQKKLIPELDASLRKGAGFATRAATADAVGSLCSTCPSAFSFPGSTMANPTVRLLRALYFASEKERGATAKDKMTHALGSLAELAPGKAVRILALKACERYRESSGSNNDPSVRKAAAATIRTISVRANTHLQDGGPKDIWVRFVLPTAFIGRHDKDEKIASLWKDVWDEGGTAAVNSSNEDGMFGVLLEEKLLPHIVRATVTALQSTSWANRKAGCAVLVELTDANILAPPPRSVDDDSSLSGEEINRLKQRSKASTVLLSECVQIIARNRIWDGKGDVVKAASRIAGRWSASAPIDGKNTKYSDCCDWPLVLQKGIQDDLFRGDGWFEHHSSVSDETEEPIDGADESPQVLSETDERNVEDDSALDLSAEKDLGDDEQLNESAESDVEESPLDGPLVFSGFCRVLAEQALRTGSNNATEGVVPYKAAALSGLAALLNSVAPSKDCQEHDAIVRHQRFIYDLIAPSLFSFIEESQSSNDSLVPPLLIARALECLASAFYEGIGASAGNDAHTDAVQLLKFFSLSTTKQPAWTVRQMSALAASSLIAKMPSEILRKNEVITTVLECSTHALKDKKFWRVRLSGLELLLSLVSRVGSQKASAADSEKQLIMESILPYKEKIVDLARKSLADNESQVTATASKITLTIAWWP